ncbi:glucose transporter 4 enhancer factor isoform X4 [Ptiloglossa arizonensis]
MSLTKRIDEVRLLESRKSARLADQDTDFARLADMAGDRKRASSHSIDVPHVIGWYTHGDASARDKSYYLPRFRVNWRSRFCRFKAGITVPRYERSSYGVERAGWLATEFRVCTASRRPTYPATGMSYSEYGSTRFPTHITRSALRFLGQPRPCTGPGRGRASPLYDSLSQSERCARREKIKLKMKGRILSRKRRPSSSNDSERLYSGWNDRIPHGCGREGCRTNERGDCMDECTAALVLMSLSCSPHSPHNPLPLHCQHNYGSWGGRGGGSGGVVVGSPGVGGTSNSSSSSGASWRSGTPSPPLSDEGASTTGSLWPTPAHPSHNQQHYPYNASGSSSSSTPVSTTTLDEGIVPDYLEEQHPRKKKIRAKVNRDPIENGPGNCATYESEQANAAVVFKCTWPGCLEIKATVAHIEEHVRQSHLGPKKSRGYDNEEDDDMSDHEEEFYYQEVAVDHMSSPPTMSHRDMARPPHEDPEYQKQLRLEATPATNNAENMLVGIRERNTVFAISQSPGTPIKHIKLSPRPFQAYQQNMGLLTVSTGKMPSSPRRIRGETKKCRKVYGMEHRDLWCTQCKWKKACSRFGD